MAQLIPIGNSQGIRIPRAVIQQAKLANKELQFKVTDEGLLISPVVAHPRADWSEKIQAILTKHPEAVQLTQEDKDWLDADLSDEDFIW
jgi:antitoxin MazE